MSDNTTPIVNELIGVTRDKLYNGEPAYGLSRDWRASYKEVVDLARQLESELQRTKEELAVAESKLKHYQRAVPIAYRDAIQKVSEQEAQLAVMAEALKRIATYINGRRETASEMLFDIISIAEKAKANLPERAKLLQKLAEYARHDAMCDASLSELKEPCTCGLDEVYDAYQSAKEK